MRRFLVVGCGGSGGATLAYLMDQLRSDLGAIRSERAPEGIDKLPKGWQFLHLDVPTSPDRLPEGLGDVRSQGGTYLSTAPQAGRYTTIDHAVSQRLAEKQELGLTATWAPREPEGVAVPVSVGAGQYRAVGRMMTINRAAEVRGVLNRVWQELNAADVASEMSRVAAADPGLGPYSAADKPVVIVVSSMAGGAGASMALDVCRLLTLVSGVDPGLIGVFMVAADVFDGLPAAKRPGVRPNALAMLGEIVAAQAGASQQHDVDMLRVLGLLSGAGVEVPFARVFPVSRFVGAERTQLGDGSPPAVYRGLGRGLAALIASDVAVSEFVSSDLGNTGQPPGNSDFLGWGADWNRLPWGSFGYAALSMGRDRYAEYAAQRVARSGVDRLLEGHLQPNNQASGLEQLSKLVSSQLEQVIERLVLPAPAPDPRQWDVVVGRWFTEQARPRDNVVAEAREIVNRVAQVLPSPDGLQAQQWGQGLRAALARHRKPVTDAADEAAYVWAWNWSHALVDRTVEVIGHEIATHGLPYAATITTRVAEHLRDAVAPALLELSRKGPGDVVALPPAVDDVLRKTKGTVLAGQEVTNAVLDGVRSEATKYVFARSAALCEQLLRSYAVDVLAPLERAIGEAQRILERARTDSDPDRGLARLTTDHYPEWPSDADARVAERFSHADNEVLLTSAEVFPTQYETDVRAAGSPEGGPAQTFRESRGVVITAVVEGRWSTTGGARAPGGLIEQTATWRSRALPKDLTNAYTVPSAASFDIHVRPAELLARARAYVNRPEESFSRFIGVSLRGYVSGADLSEGERALRPGELVSKFRDALTLARPLAAVNPEVVTALHSVPMQYRYKFSAAPFQDLGLADDLARVLTETIDIDESSARNLDSALRDADRSITRIDIFGSYMNYAPLAFESVLRPVAEQWGQTPAHGRPDFWRWRRARPLPAALPMADAERRAMVAGWFVSQITGDLMIPSAPFSDPVRIWDEELAEWLSFPHPMLTPPTSPGFRGYDWLPAVLESILIAYTDSHEFPVMSSLRPYRALRSAYDDSPYAPASGQAELAGRRRLMAWLSSDDGQSPSGGRSRVEGIEAATTPRERAEAAKRWLTIPLDLAAMFIPPGRGGGPSGGTGAGGGTSATAKSGDYRIISTRRLAATTPIFRDLAPDVRWACENLTSLLDEVEFDDPVF